MNVISLILLEHLGMLKIHKLCLLKHISNCLFSLDMTRTTECNSIFTLIEPKQNCHCNQNRLSGNCGFLLFYYNRKISQAIISYWLMSIDVNTKCFSPSLLLSVSINVMHLYEKIYHSKINSRLLYKNVNRSKI